MAKKNKRKKTVQFSGAKKKAANIKQFAGASAAPHASPLQALAIPPGILEAQDLAERHLEIDSVQAEPMAFATSDGRVDRTNILGTSIGIKESDGLLTGEWAVRLYVREKVKESEISDGLAPRDIGGFPTDIVQIGDVVPENKYRERSEPARCGSSCGHLAVTAGTIGALCLRDDRLYLLSNNHVLANTNKADPGDYILHPGPLDAGIQFDNVIAQLEFFHEIDFSSNASNYVDAALAWTAYRFVTPKHHDFTIDTNVLEEDEVSYGMPVMKNGRTTGWTFGQVTGLNASLPVNFGTRFNPIFARFKGQLEIQGVSTKFSSGGDSGSLIVEQATKRPTGLLFAGDGIRTWANPITKVMEELEIDELLNARVGL